MRRQPACDSPALAPRRGQGQDSTSAKVGGWADAMAGRVPYVICDKAAADAGTEGAKAADLLLRTSEPSVVEGEAS